MFPGDNNLYCITKLNYDYIETLCKAHVTSSIKTDSIENQKRQAHKGLEEESVVYFATQAAQRSPLLTSTGPSLLCNSNNEAKQTKENPVIHFSVRYSPGCLTFLFPQCLSLSTRLLCLLLLPLSNAGIISLSHHTWFYAMLALNLGHSTCQISTVSTALYT